MTATFIQLHYLTCYGASLLNRDDVGLAKRLPFGGATRTRVSSQCLKRHWRTSDGEHSLARLGVPDSVRSRLTFERLIARPLIDEGQPEQAVRAVTEAVMVELLGKSQKSKAKAEEGAEPELETGQVTVLGSREIEFIKNEVRTLTGQVDKPTNAAKVVKAHFKGEAKKNLQALPAGCGLSAAMFGRMVTSDVLARTDAAIHVAHAFTVHGEYAEPDYFSALDDLTKQDGELGSGHINSTELTSGMFYGYVVVDLPLLVSNLEGCPRQTWQDADRARAAQLTSALLQLIATVSPGAKLGSTAPYAYADMMLCEVGDQQPRSLANAFLSPVRSIPDLRSNAYRALDAHVGEIDEMYPFEGQRGLAIRGAQHELQALAGAERLSLPALARWTAGRVAE